MKKNFNRRSSHGHCGSKRRELARQHAHSRGSHTIAHALTSTQLQPLCAKRHLSYYSIWNGIFSLKVPEGGGANRSTRRKPPYSLPAIRYHILEEKIQRPSQEVNPHPPTLVII